MNNLSNELVLDGADWAVFVVYLLVIALIAFWSGRGRKTTAQEYFLAGDSVPWFVVGTSMVVSMLSTEQMVGQNGASYKHGFCVAIADIYLLPPITLLVWIFLPIYLRRRVMTIPQFLELRYGAVLRDIFSIVTVVSYPLVFLSMVLYTGGTLLSALFPFHIVYDSHDISVHFWSVILVLSTAIYTTWGGLKAVVWTDFVQFFVLAFAGAAIFLFGLHAIDGGTDLGFIWRGWDRLLTDQNERFHLVKAADHPLVPWPSLFMRIMTTQLFYHCANQFIVQRTLAAKSDWDARMGALSFGVVGLLVPFVDLFPGMIAYQLNPNLDEADSALAYVMLAVVPLGWGIRGLILAGLAAAIMSTLSSLINSTATVFTLDIYQKRIRPQSTEKHLLKVGRISCFVTSIIALAWTPLIGSYELVFEYFQAFVSYIAAPSGAVFLLGVFWRRATHKAAVTAMVVGLPFCLVTEILGKVWESFPRIPFVYLSFVGWLISLVTMVVVSLLDRPPEQERIKDLLWDVSTLREPTDGGKRRPWYQRLWFWYVLFAAAWLVLILRFW